MNYYCIMNEKIAIITCLVNCACIALLINNSRQAKKINQNDLLKNDQSKHDDFDLSKKSENILVDCSDKDILVDCIKKYLHRLYFDERWLALDLKKETGMNILFEVDEMCKEGIKREIIFPTNEKLYVKEWINVILHTKVLRHNAKLFNNINAVLFNSSPDFLIHALQFDHDKPFGILMHQVNPLKKIIAMNYSIVLVYILKYIYSALDTADVVKMFILSRLVLNSQECSGYNLTIEAATKFCEFAQQKKCKIDVFTLKQIGFLFLKLKYPAFCQPITLFSSDYNIQDLVLNIYNHITHYSVIELIPNKIAGRGYNRNQEFCIAFEELHDVWKIAMEPRLFEDAKKLYDNLYAKCF
jgi:hypothetical protein